MEVEFPTPIQVEPGATGRQIFVFPIWVEVVDGQIVSMTANDQDTYIFEYKSRPGVIGMCVRNAHERGGLPNWHPPEEALAVPRLAARVLRGI